jgi:hypothetical protein
MDLFLLNIQTLREVMPQNGYGSLISIVSYSEMQVVPRRAATHFIILPTMVKGILSPYPTVVIVVMAHQKASNMDLIALND